VVCLMVPAGGVYYSPHLWCVMYPPLGLGFVTFLHFACRGIFRVILKAFWVKLL
jgi:hypothetical protein